MGNAYGGDIIGRDIGGGSTFGLSLSMTSAAESFAAGAFFLRGSAVMTGPHRT